MTQRRLFVTTALPYANGNFHIGHMMEYIQADIWVRYQRMQGHAVNFVCADDTHGAPIMIAAEKAGLTPQQFVANMEIAVGVGQGGGDKQLARHGGVGAFRATLTREKGAILDRPAEKLADRGPLRQRVSAAQGHEFSGIGFFK